MNWILGLFLFCAVVPGAWASSDSAYVFSPEGASVGDVYYLNGSISEKWTKTEWEKYYSVAKWLVQHHLRVIMNPIAYAEDLREAVQSPKTVAIIWSSHGYKNGDTEDAGENILPKDIFAKQASTQLRLIVLSNCYSNLTLNRYQFPKWTRVRYWTDVTTTRQMIDYLFGDNFNRDLGYK